MSLQLILKILKMAFYSLYLVLIIYISIIYTLIYLYLINARLLIRLSIIKLSFKILIIIYILLLTSYITASIYLGSTYLQIYLIVLTFSPDISSKYKVAAIYIIFLQSLTALRLNLSTNKLRAAFTIYQTTFISVINFN